MLDIIIPAYNTHKTIIKTLLSISLQTLKDRVNVCIVNDGSDIDYKKEVELFSEVLNIKQISLKNNMGPGVARQSGLNETNSKYVMFIDSDDFLVDCYSLKYIFQIIDENQYDVICGIIVRELDEEEFETTNNHQGCLHGKIYKRSYLEENNIYFNDSYTNEDHAFNQLCLLCEPEIYFLDKEIYFYRNNTDSITRKNKEHFDFYDLESYAINLAWAIREGEKRDCYCQKLAMVTYSALFYMYLSYISNINNKNKNLILDWIKPLMKYYKKYKDYLDEEEISEIYKGYNYTELVPISFNEFLNLYKKNNNN